MILLYHRVAEPRDDPFRLSVSPERFAGHLEALREHYRLTTLDGLLDELDHGGGADRPAVVVTFDDGYADNLEVAAPIARRHEVPFTLFVAVDPVLDGTPFWWDRLAGMLLGSGWSDRLSLELGDREQTIPMRTHADRLRACIRLHRLLRPLRDPERSVVLDRIEDACRPSDPHPTGRPLTVDELRTLDRAPGVTIGSHTKSHPQLTSLGPAELEYEIADSRVELERVLGHTVDLFSYPYGRGRDLDQASIRTAAESGYRAACTTVQRAVSDRAQRHALPRRTVVDSTPEALLNGLRTLLPAS